MGLLSYIIINLFNYVNTGRPVGSVGNLESFWRWDVSSNLGAVTRTGILLLEQFIH